MSSILCKMVLKVVQLNLHRSIAASSNLINFSFDIALLQEPHLSSLKASNLDLYYSNKSARTAIACRRGVNFTFAPEYSSRDCTTGLIYSGQKKVFITSLYLEQPPGTPKYDDAIKLIHVHEWKKLLNKCRTNSIPCMTGVDCNAHSVQWGCKDENLRGKILEELIAQFGLRIENRGDTPTYSRENASSIIDLTLTMGAINVSGWTVSSKASLSDHKAVEFEIHDHVLRQLADGYNYLKMDWEKFRSEAAALHSPQTDQVWTTTRIENEVNDVYKAIKNALWNSAPKRGGKPKPYRIWWNTECETEKSITVGLQKKWWKNNLHDTWVQYKAAKFRLKKAIKKAKNSSWRELVGDADSMKKISDLNRILSGNQRKSFGLFKKPNGEVCTDQRENLEFLLKSHFKGEHTNGIADRHHEGLVQLDGIYAVEAFKEAVKKFRPHAAAGPDGIKPIVLQNLPEGLIQTLVNIFEASLRLQYIPMEWRKSDVIFACKGGDRDLNDPRSFRPISLTSFLFKAHERLNGWWCEDEGLDLAMHDHQFAFRKGRNTEQALSMTIDRIEKGLSNKEFGLVVLMDIRGAFDNIKTESIIAAMNKYGVPPPISRWYKAYLQDRYSTVEQNGVKVTLRVTDGTPQGGVLSPPLGWNLAFNDLLQRMDKGPALSVGFADDDSLTITGIDPPSMVRSMQKELNKAVEWAKECGLTICPKKTVAMFFKGRRKYDVPLKDIMLEGKPISYVKSANYLGVLLNDKLNWNEHITNRCKKAKSQMMTINNTLSKIWGPKPTWVKYAYTGIIRPSITYASCIWAKAVDYKGMAKKLESVQRLGLLAISHVRRSTPTKALQLLYNVAPLDLHIKNTALKAFLRLNLKVDVHAGHRKFLRDLLPQSLRNRSLDKISPRQLSRPNPVLISISKGEDDDGNADFMCYTDGSLLDGKAGAGGIVLERKEGKLHELATICHRYLDATVYQAELLGIKLAAEYVGSLDVQHKRITFCIDNQAAIKALKGASTTQLSVWQTWAALSYLIGNNNTVKLTWVKAHVGTKYNEYADSAAKAATNRENGTIAPLSLASVNSRLDDMTIAIWNKQWESYGEARQAKTFIEGVNSRRANSLLTYPKKLLGQAVRFITGHVFMKRHNKVLEHGTRNLPTEDIACTLCGTEEETPTHLFLRCPRLTKIRAEVTGRYVIDDDTFHQYKVREMMIFMSDSRIRALEGDEDE